MTNLDIKPWERQEREGAEVFSYFVLFRDEGPNRTARKVAEKLKRPVSRFNNLMSRWDWWARAQAWDDEQDRVKREAMLDQIRAMSERHAQIAVLMQQKIVQRLEMVKPEELSLSDLLEWLDTAIRTERLARGLGSEGQPAEQSVQQAAQIIITMPDNSRDDSVKPVVIVEPRGANEKIASKKKVEQEPILMLPERGEVIDGAE